MVREVSMKKIQGSILVHKIIQVRGWDLRIRGIGKDRDRFVINWGLGKDMWKES